jgi:hypothetical protein
MGQDFSFPTAVDSTVVLGSHLVLIDQHNMHRRRQELVEAQFVAAVDVNSGRKERFDHDQQVGDVVLVCNQSAADQQIRPALLTARVSSDRWIRMPPK